MENSQALKQAIWDAARIIDPAAWADLDDQRKRYPADPFSRFLKADRVAASIGKAKGVLARAEHQPA